ncbi:MAG TPA: hypothetical protein VGV64_01945, partial [Thermoplasmata archaeon]|nr:hypothetical protein [Thermoplasmata archaeon]
AAAELVARRSMSWAWRAFGGRDVHVEAEVTGAERPDRVRRGLSKADDRRASVVFLVSSPARARRVRSVLRAQGRRASSAQVWTLRLGPGLGPASKPLPSSDPP